MANDIHEFLYIRKSCVDTCQGSHTHTHLHRHTLPDTYKDTADRKVYMSSFSGFPCIS